MNTTTATQTSSAAVAACTAAAAHRRDHHHAPHEECHPHAVEVVHLGVLAVVVCHDCAADSGFLPEREAESISQLHRRSTLTATERLIRPDAA
jgi:hypothetical protein